MYQISKYNFPEELVKFRDQFLSERKKMGRANNRLQHIRNSINRLYQFLIEKGITDLASLTQTQVIRFQYFLYQVIHYTAYSTVRCLQNIDLFYRYLYHNNLIWKNPFSEIKYIEPPELEKREIKRYYNFDELTRRWTNWMKDRGEHIENVKDKLGAVGLFINFLKDKGLKTIYKVEPETIEEYKKFLSGYQYEPGKFYSPFTQVIHLRNVCQFLLYLHRERLIRQNPAKHVILRKYYKELEERYRNKIQPRQKQRDLDIPNPEVRGLFEKFIQYHLSGGGSSESVRNYRIAVEKFYSFISGRGITDLRKVTKSDFMDFQSWLANIKTRNGTKYAQNTIQCLIISLRGFIRYLVNYDYLVCDHSANLELPKGEDGIPHSCMTEREVKLLLNEPDITRPIGLRDKAIMEVLYSTGIRAKELAGVRVGDIDFTGGLLRVEEPKGGKSYQRIIPIGNVACSYVKQYLEKVRPLFDRSNEKGWLFLSSAGQKFYRSSLSSIIRKYLFRCGLRKKITTHSFRVSCATHMLLHKADIRYVQQQLGHRSIRTTQGYTRLVPKDLKLVHSRCHPREKILDKIV